MSPDPTVRKSSTETVFHSLPTSGIIGPAAEWDAQLRLKYWSPQAEMFFGWKSEEVLGQGMFELGLIHPEDASILQSAIARMSRSNPSTVVQSRSLTRDGRIVNCEWHNWIHCDEDGKLRSLSSVITDRSGEPTYYEDTRYDSHNLYRAAFEEAPIGMAYIAMDGRWLTFNPRYCEIVGYSPDELRTLKFLDLVHPDDTGQVSLAIERLQNGEIPQASLERRYLRKGGLSVWVNLTLSLVRNENQLPRFLMAAVEDINVRKMAEQALRNSEEQFRQLGESLPNILWITTPEGYGNYFNSEWYEYTGQTPFDSAGWGWSNVLHPLDRQRVMEEWKRSVAYGGHFDSEYRLRRRDGEYRWFLARGLPMRGDDGRVLRWFGTSTDITDRKLAEEALQEREERFRSLAETVPAMISVTDAEGHNEYLNSMWYRYTGQSEEEALGSGFLEVVHPEDGEAAQQGWRQSQGVDADYEVEYRIRRADGMYRWHLVRIRALRDDSGAVVRWLGSYTDIHEQRIAAEEIQRTHERLLAAMAASDTGTFRWDPSNDCFLEFDDRLKRLFGIPLEHRVLATKELLAHVHPEDLPELTNRLDACRRGADFEMEFRVVHPDGEVRWLYDRAKMVRSEAGKPAHLVGACTDISERKSAEEALRRSEQLATTGRFAATVAHEINNPLESVVNLVFLMKQNRTLPDEIRYFLDLADEELTRISHLTRQTLGFYRESSAPQRVMISELFGNLRAIYGPRLRNKRIDLRTEAKRETAILGLKGELRQLLANLLGNAIDAVPLDGRIRLRVRGARNLCGSPGIRITIADNGSGISTENLSRIFDPFFSTKKDFGTGLGLWISREIVEKHSGSIRVRTSCARGKSWSAFSIFLPQAAAAPWAAKPGSHSGS